MPFLPRNAVLFGVVVFVIAFAMGYQSGDRSRGIASAQAEEKDNSSAQQKQRLAGIQGIVGSWKGTAQVQRGSTKGGWVEKADWAWDFSGGSVALVGKVAEGKHLHALRLTAHDEPKKFQLELIGADDKPLPVAWPGTQGEDGSLVFAKPQAADGELARITIRQVASGDRMLLLLEKSSAASANGFSRIAEVGYTRKGSGFGQGVQGRECIVTGGAGTMEVSFMGKTYLVCCTGCRDYFNDNPEKALAEYRERKEQEKKK